MEIYTRPGSKIQPVLPGRPIKSGEKIIMARIVKHFLYAAIALFAWSPLCAMTLDEAVRKALENNPQIQEAKAEISAIRAKVSEAKSHRYPKLDFAAAVAVMNEEPEMKMPELHLAALGGMPISLPNMALSDSTVSIGALNLSMPLFTSGRVGHGVNQAKAGTEAVEAAYEAVRAEVAFLTIKAYLTAVLTTRVEHVNRQAYDTINEHLGHAVRLFEENQIPRYEVLRAETEVANAKKRLTDAQNNRDLAIAFLQNLMGASPGREITLDTDITPIPEVVEQYDALADEAVRQSHALIALEAKDKMYREAEAGAKSERLPVLAAFASQVLYHNEQPFTIPSTIAGVVLNVPLFDGGASGAKAAGQRAMRKKNEYEKEKTQNNLRLEVMQYNLDLKSSKSALESSKKSIETAAESLRLAELRFAEGVGTGIEISDAALALLVARTNEIQARHQNNLAAYGLAKTSNKLLQIVNAE